MTYHPRERTAKILNWTLHKIRSVPYPVTLRWAFYRCVQEKGLTKKQYKSFKLWTAKARKDLWGGWNPATLVDDTREIYGGGGGYEKFDKWIDSLKDLKPRYEVYSGQDELVMIWFEAMAMFSQFKHYCEPYRVLYAPFRGDPSIYLKWRIANQLASLYLEYEKPIRILYFGDYEPFKDRGSMAKGLTIPTDALKDIAPWFEWQVIGYNFNDKEEAYELFDELEEAEALRFERVGLNREHVEEWDLPENPTRPGEYQWEALSDEQAEELIVGSIERYWDTNHVEEVEEREAKDGERWSNIIDEVLEELKGGEKNEKETMENCGRVSR